MSVFKFGRVLCDDDHLLNNSQQQRWSGLVFIYIDTKKIKHFTVYLNSSCCYSTQLIERITVTITLVFSTFAAMLAFIFRLNQDCF